VVSGRGRTRLLAQYPFVERRDVVSGPATDAQDQDQGPTGPGPALVHIQDERGRPLGIGTWAARSPVALRILELCPRPEGAAPRAGSLGRLPRLIDIVAERLPRAVARRALVSRQRDAYRVVHGEGDGLPGLFVDRYGDAAVIQTTSVAMNAAVAELGTLVRDALGVRLVVERDDGSARDFEGLPRQRAVLAGQGQTRVVYRLGENAFETDLLSGSKTGGFLDQADNQRLVAELAPAGARCLDAFTAHGGFALALARKGGEVLALDQDPASVELAAANARRNGLGNVELRRDNAFDALRRFEAAGERFDVVVVDPPALAKRKSDLAAALRAYKELILRGLRVTRPEGLTVVCSCSGRVSRGEFEAVVTDAVADSGRPAQILARLGAGLDHPERVGLPSTGHLKCWILRPF